MRTAPAIVLIAAFAALSSIGDTSAAGNIVAVPPAEYRPTLVVPKAARRARRPGRARVPPRAAGPQPGRARIAQARRTPSAPSSVRVGRPAFVEEPSARDRLSAASCRRHRARSCSPTSRGRRWPTAGAPPASRSPRPVPRRCGCRCRCPLRIPISRFVSPATAAKAGVQGTYPANAVAEAAARATRSGRRCSKATGRRSRCTRPPARPSTASNSRSGRFRISSSPATTLRRIDAKRAEDIGNSGSCNIDFACVTPSAALSQAGDAVGKLVFNERSGFTFLCSGTMLNDSMTSFAPYLFTAAHCIERCLQRRINGQRLLVLPRDLLRKPHRTPLRTADRRLDAARTERRLRLGAASPQRSPAGRSAVLRLARRARADQRDQPLRCTIRAATSSCAARARCSATTRSATARASCRCAGARARPRPVRPARACSRSCRSGGYYELRGGLFGGDASCSNRAGVDYYSRLDNMLPVTRQYLTPDAANPTGQTVVVEYYNRSLDHFFMTVDADEINLLDTGVFRGWERTGVRFLAYTSQRPGTNPVCRFYLSPPRPDTHFYSGEPSEVRRRPPGRFPDWTYESPVGLLHLPCRMSSPVLARRARGRSGGSSTPA